LLRRQIRRIRRTQFQHIRKQAIRYRTTRIRDIGITIARNRSGKKKEEREVISEATNLDYKGFLSCLRFKRGIRTGSSRGEAGSIAYCICIFRVIKLRFRRLIAFMSNQLKLLFFVRGKRLI
jgi:hypothetical protein